ncbi:MAG TPA: SEC-C domain-containing protein [Baekduia sp.]|uniref:SEC-C domain-containing protein n=1 Tax=Baekduia sp. TaxID=2600305 RepID=UPI002CB315F2|nr:SEC-C domain-containing protein [Baekduia sp.]HMJ36762.1 SEC-C domain-containing protein [Baekduia sp.]
MDELLVSPGRNDPCWCGSMNKYKSCHGRGPQFGPGAALPSDDPEDGSIWIAPDTALAPEAIQDMMRNLRGAPINAPSSEPEQRPRRINAFSQTLAEAAVGAPPLTLKEIAAERVGGIDALGLGSEDVTYLRSRLADFSPEAHEELLGVIFRAAKSTLDRLRHDATLVDAPTALWARSGDARRLAGQTLLWADHYLVADRVAAHFLDCPERGRLAGAAEGLAAEAQLRPLLQAGAVALVPEEAAEVLVAEEAYATTDESLAQEAFVVWVMSQLQISGPTEREVVFVNALDAHDLGEMFFHARIDEANDDGRFTTSMLRRRYDPAYDYKPWIAQVRRQVAAHRIQQLNFDLAVAETLGGQLLATSLFDARLLGRLGRDAATPQHLIWADVPMLPTADPDTLVRIAAEDELVEALRRTVRRGMAAAAGPSGQTAAVEIAAQLREDAAQLERTIRRDQIWKLAGPAAAGVAGLGLGAVVGPLGFAAAALGMAGAVSPLIADRRARREQAAYAVHIADRVRRRRS